MCHSSSDQCGQIGESSFTAEYPSQEGDADTAFTFSATLINNTLSSQTYSFTANAPTGWQVSFLPSGETTKVAALDVEARTTQAVDISVTPPENIEAGTYEIPCTATSVNETMTIDLSVTITGSYAMSLSTPSGRLSLDAYANQESAVQLSLTNTGNSDLTNVNLTSSAPSGWNVRFSTETIDVIEPGATVETTAYITPGEEAMSGDYVTTLTASSSDASDSAEFRITVKTETKWGLTGIGIIVVLVVSGVLVALLMRSSMFSGEAVPFVMELPPYRVPTMRATLSHMWDRCAQYLRKMGGLILIASVAVWFLSYYPTPDAAAPAETMEEHYENSYLGQVGQACSPVFEPLGLNWKASIAILTGLPAKEIVVSTLGVLYSEQGDAPEAELDSPTLSQRLVASGDFTPASALAFLVFILLYLPCIATIVAIAAEIGWRWACISVLYNTALAWIMAYLTYHLFSWL
mgnify:CR=1 FL=1